MDEFSLHPDAPLRPHRFSRLRQVWSLARYGVWALLLLGTSGIGVVSLFGDNTGGVFGSSPEPRTASRAPRQSVWHCEYPPDATER